MEKTIGKIKFFEENGDDKGDLGLDVVMSGMM